MTRSSLSPCRSGGGAHRPAGVSGIGLPAKQDALGVGGTDLIVSLVSYSAETNGAMRVYAQVRNAGAPLAANTVLAIRRCDALGAPEAGAALATVEVPALEPGRLAQVALDLPVGTQPEGDAFYQLRGDEANTVADVDTNNNVTVFSAYRWLDADGDGIPDWWEENISVGLPPPLPEPWLRTVSTHCCKRSLPDLTRMIQTLFCGLRDWRRWAPTPRQVDSESHGVPWPTSSIAPYQLNQSRIGHDFA